MAEVIADMAGLRFARADVPLLDRVLTALRGGTEAFTVPEGYLTGGDGGRLRRRMLTRRRDDGTIELAANLAVHETMTGVGLVDLTASVPAHVVTRQNWARHRSTAADESIVTTPPMEYRMPWCGTSRW